MEWPVLFLLQPIGTFHGKAKQIKFSGPKLLATAYPLRIPERIE